MILTDEQLSIIHEVRAELSEQNEFGYICCSIENVINQRFDVEVLEDASGALEAFNEFTDSIRVALKRHSTVFVYLRHEVRGFRDLPINVQNEQADLARLAWLDRMIETRTIA